MSNSRESHVSGILARERITLARGRFQIASAIMFRSEIYGRTKPSGTYRHLFIVTENHLLQPLVHSFFSLLFLFLSYFFHRVRSLWSFSSLIHVNLLLTPAIEDDHPWYHSMETWTTALNAISYNDRNATFGKSRLPHYKCTRFSLVKKIFLFY